MARLLREFTTQGDNEHDYSSIGVRAPYEKRPDDERWRPASKKLNMFKNFATNAEKQRYDFDIWRYMKRFLRHFLEFSTNADELTTRRNSPSISALCDTSFSTCQYPF